MGKNLLPCPFCGSTKVATYRFEGENGAFVIQCGSCCAEGPFRATEAEAIEDWNHRVEGKKSSEVIEDEPMKFTPDRMPSTFCHISADISVGGAYVDGEECEADNAKDDDATLAMPGTEKTNRGWRWDTYIDVVEGRIIGWREGTIARTYFKPCDDFEVKYMNCEYIGYVPDCFSPAEEGYGDYVFMEIDEKGFIKNWSKDKFTQFVREWM